MNNQRDKSIDILTTYPVFRYGMLLLKKNRAKNFITQNVIISITVTLLIVLSSVIDGTLFLSKEDIGLLEHPAIWAFIAAQIFIPIVLVKSLEKFLEIPQWEQGIISRDFLNQKFVVYLEVFKSNVSRQTNLGRVVYSIFISIGFVGFIWNSYQNQLPVKFLGFDFWDSINHPYGYWITRFYKFYLWVILFPPLAHIQVLLLFSVRDLVKDATLTDNLNLNPYHQDNCGGASIFIDTVLKPVFPILIISSMLTLCVFIVHQKFDPTTILSLSLTNIVCLMLYFIPAFSFRRAILNEKKRHLDEIATIQNKILLLIYKKKWESFTDEDDKKVDIINSLANISRQIRGISNWPHLTSLLKLQGLILSPSVIGVVIKLTQPIISQIVHR